VIRECLRAPQYRRNPCLSCYLHKRELGGSMKKIIVTAVIAAALAPLGALAQERTGDAALGALSGAVVLGPIGAVAGAVVGYTTGPAIASSWGLRRGSHHRRREARR
jgi:hypothetical protein